MAKKPMPLLSVVIPTHNRPHYAISCLESLLGIEDERLEIAVHDTSDDPQLEAAIASHRGDSRLTYVRNPIKLNMTGNHNAAMSLATGEYVCVIGDDDTILPAALAAADWASRHGLEALTPKIVANYAWPDFESASFGMGHAGRLYINPRFGGGRVVDSATALAGTLASSADGTNRLPKTYHGIVKRQVLQRIKERSGDYFHGAAADMSGAIGVALMTSRYLELDYPLTLPGVSRKSASGRAGVKALRGDLQSPDLAMIFAQREWPAIIPAFFSVETIWAHAAIATLERLAREQLEAFNFVHLYGRCLVHHHDRRREIIKSLAAYQEDSGRTAAALRVALALAMTDELSRSGWRLAKRASRPTAAGGRNYIAGLSSIASAQRAAVEYLNGMAPNLQDCLDRSWEGRSG